MALIGAGAVARAQVDLSTRALEARVDERDDGMKWIVLVGANHDAQLIAARTNEGTERKEGDDIDERFYERRVQLLTGEPRQHEARVLRQRRGLIRPCAR